MLEVAGDGGVERRVALLLRRAPRIRFLTPSASAGRPAVRGVLRVVVGIVRRQVIRVVIAPFAQQFPRRRHVLASGLALANPAQLLGERERRGVDALAAMVGDRVLRHLSPALPFAPA